MKVVDKNDLSEIVNVLNNNGLVAFPTETVYGLGIKASSLDNYNKLVKVKNRTPNKPFTLMISNINQVKDIVYINEVATKVITKFTPGPLTIILKAKENIPSYLDLNSGFIGIRIPKDTFVLKMIDLVNYPLFVPSANPSNLVPAKNHLEVINYFNDKVDLVVKGESIENIPSTVIKIDGDKISVLREGKITLKEIMEEIR
ncbi:MAG: threonylcarbamoyl-AMP synthase [Firmicutes bacterium]|uniref:L-threonylcarbamoyladenylate synthase n=1 Tax=Candidatus Onthovivens merdipullorum TaxID=2840889 RepID=A0A9D9GX62_9BACL|nr:threonylcarbamoyl-AMP synthase [Candidatus Onthovivens merdipullorum]